MVSEPYVTLMRLIFYDILNYVRMNHAEPVLLKDK